MRRLGHSSRNKQASALNLDGSSLNIRPLTPAIGAEVDDIDLSVALSDEQVDKVSSAFRKHLVLFFRNQELQPADLVRFSRLFGPVGSYPFAEPLPGHPEVIAIIKEPEQKTVFGGIWHTDSTYLETPSAASVLYSLEVPEVGGDTLFANMYDAWERLDEGIKETIKNRVARHSSAKNRAKLRADHLETGAMKAVEKKSGDVREAMHPLVRKHPHTSKPSLYVSPAHTTAIEGLDSGESDEILAHLFEHVLHDDFKCRFRWTPGTLAIWDNRCTLHYPVNDYPGVRRVMHRVTIDGEKPSAYYWY